MYDELYMGALLMPKIELFPYSTSYPMVLLWVLLCFFGKIPQTKPPTIWGDVN